MLSLLGALACSHSLLLSQVECSNQETVAAAAKPASRAVAPPAAVRLQPVQMGEAQQAAARRGGLQRLVEAAALPCQQLRAGLLSHLAPHMLVDIPVCRPHTTEATDCSPCQAAARPASG